MDAIREKGLLMTTTGNLRRNLLVALGVAALALPAAAVAKPGNGQHKGKGHSKHHGVAYVFKGTYNADGSVHVLAGNSRVRKGGYVGHDVQFDFANAKVVVADTNQDGKSDLSDVQAGDKVVVKARLPRRDPGSEPFAARGLVDQSHPLDADDAPEPGEASEPAAD